MEDNELHKLQKQFDSKWILPVSSDGHRPQHKRRKVLTSNVVCRYCGCLTALRGYKSRPNGVKCPACHVYYFI